ncbi:MAG: hypothetical protein H7067_18425 [Burkholderiales bacterium]|nr:hypothetical protein [Opitutaceae bacterium]
MKRPTSFVHRQAGWVLKTTIIGAALLVTALVIVPTTSCGCGSRESGARSVDSSNLRQIGQASLIYASDHKDQLPQTDSVIDYAAELARDAGLNDATIWITSGNDATAQGLTTVLTVDRTAPSPEFVRTRLDFTVVARGLNANLPSTTPVAWTRGLQPDGTWSKDSPYKGEGGHIVFLGGNVSFYSNLATSPLTRFDDPKATTTDIRQALPPDALIAEPIAQ